MEISKVEHYIIGIIPMLVLITQLTLERSQMRRLRGILIKDHILGIITIVMAFGILVLISVKRLQLFQDISIRFPFGFLATQWIIVHILSMLMYRLHLNILPFQLILLTDIYSK